MIQHKNIPEELNGEDTLYHYTSINIATEYILHEKRLRLSPRIESNDPLENSNPIFGNIGYGSDESKMATSNDANEIYYTVINKLKTLRQICFCMNEIEDPRINFMRPFEYYGFLKPRMWDQYADKYKGVCLAFSKSKLIKNSNIFHKQIEYFNYDNLNLNLSINRNELKELGHDAYYEEFYSKVESVLFRKHLDYNGESEYRICKYKEEQIDYINTGNCLKAIIVSEEYTNDYSKQVLNTYAEKLDVDLLSVSWHADRVIISSKNQLELDRTDRGELTKTQHYL